jgi:acyl dehydratase
MAEPPEELPEDRLLDAELEQTFPASDPLPYTHDVRPMHLDDFHVGQRFASGTIVVEEAEIKSFAARFDPQPFHLDEVAAKDSLFGGLAASGWHTAALTMRLLVLHGIPVAGGLIGLGGEITWPTPTRPGDVLRVESEVVAVTPSRSKPDRGVVTIRHRTLNQHDQAVQEATVKIFVKRVPAAGR